jgi:hypothetical protein
MFNSLIWIFDISNGIDNINYPLTIEESIGN